MPKEMVISATPHETRVAIMEEGQLCEIYVEREKEFALVGSIYKGRVTRVLPGMQSAFVDIGLDSDAFLYVSDFLEDIEEFDHIVTTVEDKVEKMQEQGGQPFAGGESGAPAALEPADVESPSLPATVAPAPAESGSASSHREQQPRPPQERRPDNRPSERPRFEGRGHGRDNRFGRGGGHRGRGRRGRDRRFGPELPSSKYASKTPEPQQTEEPAPVGENFTPIVLPGESLAKYKSRPITPSTPAMLAGDPVVTATGSTPIDAAEPETRHEVREPRVETRAPAFGGLEPLPGESISKARIMPEVERQSEVEQQLEVEQQSAPASHREEHEDFEIEPEVTSREEIDDFEGHTESPAGLEHGPESELSEEEAKALSEHVADVQLEEVERAIEESEAAARELQEAEAEGAELDESELEDEEDDIEAEEGLLEIDSQIDNQPGVIAEGETQESSTFVESGIGIERIEGSQSEEGAEHGAPEAERMAEAGSSEAPSRSESQPWKARVSGDYRGRMQHPARRGRDRGRRDDRGRRHQQARGGHRPQPKRPQLISELLKQGQEIIVQIAKEPLGKKGARITSHIALPGRFLVYMPTLDHTGVSRKISSAEERSRLRRLVTDSKGQFGGGFIVRTAAEGASDDEIRMDVEFLTHTWAGIKNRGEQRKAPTLLHRDLNLVERILRDYLNPEFTAIWVDNEDEFTKVVEFVSRFQPNMTNRVKLYGKETPIFEEFGIQQEIDKGLRPKVWLKSGGYIVINHTEALVAIDVNTGKFVGRGSTRLEDTIVRTNVEAVKEIVRQMRLRDLGGIIIIDFIDMEERRNREKVMAALEDALKSDRAPSKVLRFNEFGLVAITRKRTKQALERTLCQPCPYCTGSGMVKSVPTLCYEIQAEARKMAPEVDAASLTLRVHPEIAKALKTRESALIEELEHWTKKSIIIQADPTLHWEQYDIY